MVRAELLARAWSGTLTLLAGVTFVGLLAIPSGEEVTVQWSWGDWEPVRQTSKWLALIVVPVVTALIAWPSVASLNSDDATDVLPGSAALQFLVMAVVIAAQMIIVLAAGF